jgi:hypothetical protein
MRVGMARLAIMTYANELRVSKPGILLGNPMALITSHLCMFAFEREGGIRAVEGNQPATGPSLLRVTSITGVFELPTMRIGMTVLAGLADVAQANLCPSRGHPAGMTSLALELGVRTQKREPAVMVVIERQVIAAPALQGMAFQAVAGTWVIVRIVVAICAPLVVKAGILHSADAIRVGFLVALLTRQNLMFAIERKVRAAMIEGLRVQRHQARLGASVLRMTLPACAGEFAMEA